MAACLLADLDTPSLILDEGRMDANIARLKRRVQGFDIALRPHLKTSKCVEIARRLVGENGAATVSTLKEAEVFSKAGIRDLLYAVGISPGKLHHVAALRARGINLTVILDSVEQAAAVARVSREAKAALPAMIEIDADGHRAGVKSGDSDRLLAVGHALVDGGAELAGVMTLAGGSYDVHGAQALAGCADVERIAATRAAGILRDAGFPCPIVSVGSTPTALFGTNFEGVSEVRAGVFAFYDLFQCSIGVCAVEDIAISVLATVLGPTATGDGWIVDAGWTALSLDAGTTLHGYGLVADERGRIYDGLTVARLNQEHGVLASPDGRSPVSLHFSIGDRVRIFPNHACATAAQHNEYHVITAGSTDNIGARWPRFAGW